MEGPNEKKEADVAEGIVPSADTTTDQELIPRPDSDVKRKVFRGKGDSLNSMAERDRARHDHAKDSFASRIANLRKI
jgi:hypothetical protein